MQKTERMYLRPLRDTCKCCGHPIEMVKLRLFGDKWVHVNRGIRGCQEKEKDGKMCCCNNAGAGR